MRRNLSTIFKKCFVILFFILQLQHTNSSSDEDNTDVSFVHDDFCTLQDRTLQPGEHYLDPVSCQIWYCRQSLIRYADVDEYTCKYVGNWPDVYVEFFKDCKENECLPELKS